MQYQSWSNNDRTYVKFLIRGKMVGNSFVINNSRIAVLCGENVNGFLPLSRVNRRIDCFQILAIKQTISYDYSIQKQSKKN